MPEGDAERGAPVISVYNRQRKLRPELAWLRRFATRALPEVLRQQPGPGEAPLPLLEEVEVSLVSDATIARLHRDFMQIAGPTDVITFQHGEIVISTETARENAGLYARSVRDELALYLVHGLLHLYGYEDGDPAEAARMHELQESLLARCLGLPAAPAFDTPFAQPTE
ncbi:MAG TPA: rRNA maturation RNase YbeY [Chthoniobacteraceae bacterium]|nr:rRNA maturation RNase YbeY [Chthoniobacteraceae bacterium]